MTAEPTNMAILHAGAHPVWADVDPQSGNVTADTIEAALTSRTKAIVVVHYGGLPAPMRAIGELARSRQIPVIEDAAHALGARVAGKALGEFSDYVMYSLQAIKHLTTVDGGMLVCRDPDDLARGRRLRWFGIDRAVARTEVDVREVGWKYHMNNVTATIGLVQLDYIEPVIARHKENGKWFDEALGALQDLTVYTAPGDTEPSYWFYTVLAERANDLSRHLTLQGIGNSKAHRRNDLHTVFASSRRSLPGLDAFFKKMLHIPCGWWVTDADRERIRLALCKGW
jgi:Predicted pyridoxal phosphate-dependent enzyme apparently involved in regulation of cell wall biogenesis